MSIGVRARDRCVGRFSLHAGSELSAFLDLPIDCGLIVMIVGERCVDIGKAELWKFCDQLVRCHALLAP